MRHDESRIQQGAVRWFRMQYPGLSGVLFSVPNGYRTSESQARVAKAEGLLSGVSDLILLYPSCGYHALCIEMKTQKGRQQPSQKDFQKAVESLGYRYVVCRSLEDFMEQVRQYVGKSRI